MKKIIAGVDYSLSSPACCILNQDHIEIHCMVKHNLIHINYLVEPISIITHEIAKDCSAYYRINYLSELFFNILKDVDEIAFEDYSFGSVGKVFGIAENTGVLKQKLFEYGIPLSLFAPSQIKKFATGKGNAKKEQMIESFETNLNIDLYKIFNINKDKGPISPLSDIADSYFIAKYLQKYLKELNKMKTKETV